MPRRSPYEISLTQREREELEGITRKYTAPYCDIMRAKITLLAAEGMENKQIGERLDLPRQIVSKWRKRFFEKRLAGLEGLAQQDVVSILQLHRLAQAEVDTVEAALILHQEPVADVVEVGVSGRQELVVGEKDHPLHPAHYMLGGVEVV